MVGRSRSCRAECKGYGNVWILPFFDNCAWLWVVHWLVRAYGYFEVGCLMSLFACSRFHCSSLLPNSLKGSLYSHLTDRQWQIFGFWVEVSSSVASSWWKSCGELSLCIGHHCSVGNLYIGITNGRGNWVQGRQDISISLCRRDHLSAWNYGSEGVFYSWVYLSSKVGFFIVNKSIPQPLETSRGPVMVWSNNISDPRVFFLFPAAMSWSQPWGLILHNSDWEHKCCIL